MTQIGIRQLRAHLGRIVRRIRGGQTVELTDHGHPVASIVPRHHVSRYEQLVADGRIVPPEGSLRKLLQRGPAPRRSDEQPHSEILAELRADER